MHGVRTALFIGAIGFSSFLLFWLEPMVGKMLLPSLGGSPSVWNVCMVVYQVALVIGYAAALFFARLSFKQQLACQALLLAAAALTLPVRFPSESLDSIAEGGNITGRLALLLVIEIGLPFIALSTVSPLLQTWWARTYGTEREPYFLYAASNAGSFIGLLGYPFLIERTWSLAQQRGSWTILFIFAALAIVLTWFVTSRLARVSSAQLSNPQEPLARIPPAQLFKWAGLAFIPSSLTLGATAYLSSDVASIPLLWVIPLAIYLFTYILAFGVKGRMRIVDRALPPIALGLLFLWLIRASQPAWLLFSAHLVFLFVASLACHKRLALLRPPPAKLTTFYLALAIGGALGGIFNSLLAPLLFTSVLEYPMAILLAAGVRITVHKRANRPRLTQLIPVMALGVIALALTFGLRPIAGIDSKAQALIATSIPLFAAFFLSRKPLQFAGVLIVITLALRSATDPNMQQAYAERNFFGISRVVIDTDDGLHTYYHGTTIHGTQSWNPAPNCEPLAYYGRGGPLGAVFNLFHASNLPRNVAAVGLGAGTVASYSRAGENWTFYEIDPAVIRIAQERAWFTYLTDCAMAKPVIALGDARLKLREAATNFYGLMILDAFTSDAIPTHLVTLEAFQLYLSRLSQDGVIACHISSRHLDLTPVLAALARELNLICLLREDPTGVGFVGAYSSRWVILSRDKDLPRRIRGEDKTVDWYVPGVQASVPYWTDDFTDVLSIISFQ